MLEALLARVRKNRTSAPVRAAAAPSAPAPVFAPPPVAAAPLPVTPPAPPVSPAPPTVESAPPAAASFRPEPGSAVQHRPLTEPPMEISDDDLVEVTTMPPEAEVSGTVELAAAVRSEPPRAEAPDADAIEADDLGPLPASEHAAVESRELEPMDDEPAPASSSRFKVPSTLDEALASAAESESDREIPVLTPPPESGPQEALPATGLESARIPDVEQLEADLEGPVSLGPTAEQLGETIELEAPRGPELEIDVTIEEEPASEPPAPVEELEVTLPRASMPSGLYDVNVTAPPPEPVVTATAPEPAAVTVPAHSAGADEPTRTVARPAIGATDVARVTLVPQSSPRSFVELLDASLGL
jgi:hypothetical protein